MNDTVNVWVSQWYQHVGKNAEPPAARATHESSSFRKYFKKITRGTLEDDMKKAAKLLDKRRSSVGLGRELSNVGEIDKSSKHDAPSTCRAHA